MCVLRPLRERDTEQRELRDAFRVALSGRPQLVVISGPRRVGKTLLVRHALEAASHTMTTVYFEATQAGAPEQLRRFHQALGAALPSSALPPGSAPRTWEEALGLAAFAARSVPLVVAIDEATYLMASTPGFSSMVQAVWDAIDVEAAPPRLALVLTGSAMGLIDEALSGQGALFRRPTLARRIEPFNAAEAYRFTGRPDPTALFEAYAACGGYPLHLDTWDFTQATGENLLRLAASPGGILLEGGALVLAGMRESYRQVLMAVGQGRSKTSEIANETGARSERGIEALLRARIVQAARPLGAPAQARAIYRVEDPYLRFWFRVLANHVQSIESGQGSQVLRHVEGAWQEQLGWAFEVAARLHAAGLAEAGVLPAGTLTGEWWTTSGQPTQVDVLGLLDHRSVALGEVRWQARPLGRSDLDGLAVKLRLVPNPVAQPTLLLWGRHGIRDGLSVGTVRGFDLADVLGADSGSRAGWRPP